jgi:transposase
VALSVRLRPASHGRLVHRRRPALFSALLASFAAEVGAGSDKHVILVLDGAGWHVAKDLEVPEGVELMFLPPYSPQIQPAERF